MTNINLDSSAHHSAPSRLINKPILTADEAAAFLGISRRDLAALDVPRHQFNRAKVWYLTAELHKWVELLPMRGQYPLSHCESTIRVKG